MLLLFALIGCVAPYQEIDLPQLARQEVSYKLKDSKITVALVDHVFDGQRNKFFSRMEYKQRINLIGFRVENQETQTLRLPENLVFQDLNGAMLPPLTASEAASLLCEDRSRDNVTVSGDGASLWKIGRFGNQMHKAKIRSDFAQDLMRQYLTGYDLQPGESAYGLLALPLPPETPFRITVERLPSVLEKN